jgi:hypothetical protein
MGSRADAPRKSILAALRDKQKGLIIAMSPFFDLFAESQSIQADQKLTSPPTEYPCSMKPLSFVFT